MYREGGYKWGGEEVVRDDLQRIDVFVECDSIWDNEKRLLLQDGGHDDDWQYFHDKQRERLVSPWRESHHSLLQTQCVPKHVRQNAFCSNKRGTCSPSATCVSWRFSIRYISFFSFHSLCAQRSTCPWRWPPYTWLPREAHADVLSGLFRKRPSSSHQICASNWPSSPTVQGTNCTRSHWSKEYISWREGRSFRRVIFPSSWIRIEHPPFNSFTQSSIDGFLEDICVFFFEPLLSKDPHTNGCIPTWKPKFIWRL